MPNAMINGYKHYWEDIDSGDVIFLLPTAASSSVALMGTSGSWRATFAL
jgi:hypothetical protein